MLAVWNGLSVMVADKSPERLIDAPFFFEFAISCRHCAAPWSDAGVQLDESYSVPSFFTPRPRILVGQA
ncbi:MAG: hypothetical protein VB875_11755, partial [Pirellulales bacterium]